MITSSSANAAAQSSRQVRFAGALVLAFHLAAVLASAQPRARRGPEFLDRAIIYQVWLRSFTPEGTLAAAAKRLPHIASLNASIVYLSPIMLQSTVGGFSNPYRIKDYYAIDPEYGTDEDLRRFVAEAHRLGLKVILDVVYYHTAPDSVMMERPEFYMRQDGEIVLGNWRLPRPDFTNPDLRRYLVDNMLHWVRNFQVDGFRCDVSFGVPLQFWEEARAALDQTNKDLILLAESEKPDEMASVFDISYNFSHMRALQRVMRDGEPASAVQAQWERARGEFPPGTRFLRAIDNHDQARAISQFGQKGALAATVLNATLDGIPFLYNGQEIGDTVATDHQAHHPIRWEIDQPEVKPGSGIPRTQRVLADWHRRLFRMRLDEPAFIHGDVVWLETTQPDSVLAYLRRTADRSVLVVVNLSNRTLTGNSRLPEAAVSFEQMLRSEPLKEVRDLRPIWDPKSDWTMEPEVSVAGQTASFRLGGFDYCVGRLAR